MSTSVSPQPVCELSNGQAQERSRILTFLSSLVPPEDASDEDLDDWESPFDYMNSTGEIVRYIRDFVLSGEWVTPELTALMATPPTLPMPGESS